MTLSLAWQPLNTVSVKKILGMPSDTLFLKSKEKTLSLYLVFAFIVPSLMESL